MVGGGLLAGFCGLLLVGGGRLIRKGGTGSLVPLASLAGAALTLGYCLYEGLSLLPWYAIFLLPGILLCLAAGVAALLDLTVDAVGPLPGVLPAIMLMLSWGSVLRVYMTHGREDLRGVVERVRGSREARMPPAPGSPLLGVFWSEVPVYDRSATVIHVREELDALMEQAEREKRDLYVDSAWRAFVMKDPADRIRVVEDEAVFERVSQLPGLDEPGNAHVVWKMRRPPAGGNSLGAVPQIR